jgi:hypothetical protein
MRIPCQAALHFAQNRSSLSNYCNNFRVRTSRRGPFHSQFSILNSQFSTVAPPCACELHAKPLFTSRRATLHFQIIATIFSCEPRAKGRSLSIFNSQFSIFPGVAQDAATVRVHIRLRGGWRQGGRCGGKHRRGPPSIKIMKKNWRRGNVWAGSKHLTSPNFS